MSTYFENIEFNDLNFKSLEVCEIEFIECRFSGIDFSPLNLPRHKFIDCEFSKCNFNNTRVSGVLFRGPRFYQTKLMGINWAETQALSVPEFVECMLDFSVFQKMNLKAAKFINCKMHELDFYEAHCIKSTWTGSDLSGTNFSGANLTEADFRMATHYRIDVRETTILKAKFSMPEAMTLLSSFNITID